LCITRCAARAHARDVAGFALGASMSIASTVFRWTYASIVSSVITHHLIIDLDREIISMSDHRKTATRRPGRSLMSISLHVVAVQGKM
jgi:hypothetical protein